MRTPMEHSGFPSEETLAEFIEGGLDRKTRDRVTHHMTECSECYETFLVATAWARSEESATPFVRRQKRWGTWAAGLAAAAVAAFTIIFFPQIAERYHDAKVNSRLSEVKECYPEGARPAEGRVTGFNYGHPAETLRGNNAGDPLAKD